MTEADTGKINTGLNRVLGLGYFYKIQEHEGEFSTKEKMRMILFICWFFIVLTTVLLSRYIFPYSIREQQLFMVASVPESLGITKENEKLPLYQQLRDKSKWIRTDNSVNVIRKCLKYSHAVNNLYLIKLINAENESRNIWFKRYSYITRDNYDHLMSQRFAEVANVLSKEFGG